MIIIYYCPNCGFKLDRQLIDGFSTCSHCHRIFDSSDKNQLLSAAWAVRRTNLSLEELMSFGYISDIQVNFVQKYVINEEKSHDELLKVINEK